MPGIRKRETGSIGSPSTCTRRTRGGFELQLLSSTNLPGETDRLHPRLDHIQHTFDRYFSSFDHSHTILILCFHPAPRPNLPRNPPRKQGNTFYGILQARVPKLLLSVVLQNHLTVSTSYSIANLPVAPSTYSNACLTTSYLML